MFLLPDLSGTFSCCINRMNIFLYALSCDSGVWRAKWCPRKGSDKGIVTFSFYTSTSLDQHSGYILSSNCLQIVAVGGGVGGGVDECRCG